MKRLLLRKFIFYAAFVFTALFFWGVSLAQQNPLTSIGYASKYGDNINLTIAGGTLIMDVDKSFASITTTGNVTSVIDGSKTLSVGNSITIAGGSILEINTTASANKLVTTVLSDQTVTISGNGSLSIATSIELNGSNKSYASLVIGPYVIVSTTNIYADKGTGNTEYDLIVNGTLKISGVLEGGFSRTNNSTYTNSIICGPNSTIEYNGGDQTVYPTTYNNLILSGSGVKTMTYVSIINGDFTMAGTTSATADIPSDATIPNYMDVKGNVTLGAKSFFNASTVKLEVEGNWTNYGNFIANASTVVFNGSSAQTISGSVATTFNNLTINNAAGITLGQDVNVSGVLNLIKGQVTTSSENLLTLNDNATVTGASNASFVNGPVQKIGNDAFTFPVGKNWKYVPISISAPTNATDAITAEYFPESAAALGDITKSGLYAVSSCEFWNLFTSSGTAAVNVSLPWDSDNACSGPGYMSDPASIVAAQFNGNSWNAYGASGTSNTTNTTVSGSVSWNTTVTISSCFTFGSTSAVDVLPVHFSNVTASEKSSGVQIDFTNETESDINYYEIERSFDGHVFSVVQRVYPTKNNYGSASYSWLDASVQEGRYAYRIKAVETSGKTVCSSVVYITLGATNSGMSVYAKGGQVILSVSKLPAGKYQLQFLSSAGQLFSMENFTHSGGSLSMSIPFNSAKAGIYILKISGILRMQQKFLLPY